MWFQNNLFIYMAASQCLNQNVVIGPSLVYMLSMWTNNNRNRKRKSSAQMLLNTAQKSGVSKAVYSKTLSGKLDIMRYLKGPWITCSSCKDHQIFSLGLSTQSDSQDLNRPNLALESLRRILDRKQHVSGAFIFFLESSQHHKCCSLTSVFTWQLEYK